MIYLLFLVGFISSLHLVFGLIYAIFFFIVGKVLGSSTLSDHGLHVAYSIDQMGNTLWLGDPDETISSRLGRALVSKKPRFWVKPLAGIVDFGAHLLSGQKNHCIKNIEYDEPFDKELISWIKK